MQMLIFLFRLDFWAGKGKMEATNGASAPKKNGAGVRIWTGMSAGRVGRSFQRDSAWRIWSARPAARKSATMAAFSSAV